VPGGPAGASVADVPGDPEQSLGDPEAAARIICLRLLDRRARSRAELADALRRRGIPDEPATAVLDRFDEVGLIDDAALARSIAGAQHAERGLARRAVAQRLQQRGFGAEVIGEALESIDSDGERARAVALVRKRRRALAQLPADVQARRLVGLLARKGYPSGMAYQVVRAELAESAETAAAADQALENPVDD
jgi:regulatory protein